MRHARRYVWVLLLSLAPMGLSQARTPGIVMDYYTGRAIFFDADTDQVTGSLALVSPPYLGTGDCLVLGDRGPAFSTDFGFRVWRLGTEAADGLAPPPNPIRISNPGEDIAASADGRFLLACDGNGQAPVSVIDVGSGTEVSTFSLGSDCNSVDVCDDGSVLVTSYNQGQVRRLLLGADGGLTDTGESLDAAYPFNVYCAPGSRSGLVVMGSDASLQSFTLPGLVAVDTRFAGYGGLTVAFGPGGGRVYGRTYNEVSAFGFDPASGQLDAEPAYQIQGVYASGGFFGMEQMAIDPGGDKLYVPTYGELRVYDAAAGALLTTLTHPDLVDPTGICLPRDPDADDDGLSDADEAAAGTDPGNADTDGDGLEDAFEVRYGLSPLVGGDAAQDPDGDGLDNLGEQAHGTDPTRPDSDGDGLSDGAEVLVHGTDPADPDTDRDHLKDGVEVAESGTDPRVADSDGGGVSDGDEVRRDGTDPLDAADDHPAGLGIVMDNGSRRAVVFDRDRQAIVSSIPMSTSGSVTTGDCLILPDGNTGFATDFAYRLSVFDLSASPPVAAPPPNPIPISNPGEDLALSPDGRFLVTCDGSGNTPVSVVDVGTRSEVSTLSLGTDCNSVDVCADGSVLVTSFLRGFVRRFDLDGAGNLSETGDELAVPQPMNVYCAPDGRSGLVVSRTQSQGLTSFRLLGLEAVDSISLPEAPMAAAISPAGDRVFVRFTRPDEGGVQGFHYDPLTADLDSMPFLSFPVATTSRYFGMEQLALDPTGTRLFVSEAATLTEFDAGTGEPLSSLFDPDLVVPTGVCLSAIDQDGDGLTDDRERALGTDPTDPDTDGDGLSDGFEARSGLDPLSADDGGQDTDGDGLDNATEQALRTDPLQPDTDRDGLSDGEEVLVRATDPRRADTDGDRLTDGDEVHVHGTDPRLADTDGGGVQDGSEILLDHTDPLDPADDRPSGLGIYGGYFSAGGGATVFDADAERIVARLPILASTTLRSCSISNDGGRGFLTNGTSKVWPVDLTTTPPDPTLSPVPISNPGSRTALSPDGRHLVVCGGSTSTPSPISVVDVDGGIEVSTTPFGTGCDAVDFCADGSVIVASYESQLLAHYQMDDAGNLRDEELRSVDLQSLPRIRCAPDGHSAILLTTTIPYEVRSFRIPGLEPIDRRSLESAGIALAVDSSGTSVYVSHFSTEGARVDVFAYDLSSGQFGATPLRSFLAPGAAEILLDRTEARLLVGTSNGSGVVSYDARTGQEVGGVRETSAFSSSVLCLRRYDRDSDGLLDDDEGPAGTDPANPDSDGDGLRDGFEVRHGLDPLDPSDAGEDLDGDGLDNLVEQAMGTDPGNPDTDADGLTDGEEVTVHGTDPRSPDSDRDDLADGLEVQLATDPLDPDTDDGKVQDGTEVIADGTDPLLGQDDRPSGPGMVTTSQGNVVVFDPESGTPLGTVPTGNGTAPDCVVSPDGRTGFVVKASLGQIWLVNLATSPPAALPQGTIFTNSAEDIAISRDGRFLVTCEQQFGQPVTVTNVATHLMVGSYFPPVFGVCSSVEVCDDGSVLASFPGSRTIRRLLLTPSGQLVDTGESLFVDGLSSVACGPGGNVGVALTSSNRLQSFRVAGLQPGDLRQLPRQGQSVAWRASGDEATLFVREMNLFAAPMEAYRIDLHTAALSTDAVFRTPISTPFLTFAGSETLAVDRTGERLWLAQRTVLRAFDSLDGSARSIRFHPDLASPTAICLPAPEDRDGDGLPDGEERRLGTDPLGVDTDGDGLTDGFEARHGLSATTPDDPQADPDEDGLTNLDEQGLGTDPSDADTDGDGIGDGDEFLLSGTDPRRSDTDGDGARDGVDNCPLIANPGQEDSIHPDGIGDRCEDFDGDGSVDAFDNCPDDANEGQTDVDADGRGDVCDPCPLDPLNDGDGDGSCAQNDNCPTVFDPLQVDGDLDGIGDVCDICPTIANPEQSEEAACIEVHGDGGSCLDAAIMLLGSDLDGALVVAESDAGPPDFLRFEVLLLECGQGDTLQFELNGVLLEALGYDPSIPCDCQAPVQMLTFSDASVLSALWRVGGENRIRIRKTGENWGLAWARMVIGRDGAASTACLLDVGGGDCTELDLCAAGFSETIPDTEVPVQDECDGCLAVPFFDSTLPGSVPLSGLPDGSQVLCVRVDPPGGGTPLQDCGTLVKQGEEFLTINGAPCGAPPVAGIRTDGEPAQCTSPDGATILLDGSLSSDPDSSPGTHDDIVLFEWFEQYGLPDEMSLGTGEMLSTTLSLGLRSITLRVTDHSGQSATDTASFEVFDGIPPTLSAVLSPAILWPPFHDMIPVQATVSASDDCGPVEIRLLDVTSSEMDDLPGGGDGRTVDDIQGAGNVPSGVDVDFQLRAERDGAGEGRTYFALYRATDVAGNVTESTALVFVPHDQGWSQEPVALRAREGPGGTALGWSPVLGAIRYSVVRGEVGRLRDTGAEIDLGPVVCLVDGTSVTSTESAPDSATPAVGEAFFYLVEIHDGERGWVGSDLAPKPRHLASGCPSG